MGTPYSAPVAGAMVLVDTGDYARSVERWYL